MVIKKNNKIYEKYKSWAKKANKDYRDNMKRNEKMDKEKGAERLKDIIG